MHQLKKVLCANRGEIARRVYRTCKEMGIYCVGIYAQNDEDLPFVREYDEVYLLKGETLAETYLNQNLIIEIALKAGVDGIHPGYGLLSENALFAQNVEKAGLVFIGPDSQAMDLMGDKLAAKQAMEKAGVPTLPGYHGDNQDPEFLFEKASSIGFPLLIKASSGGGGKGMRVVHSLEEFLENLRSAQHEALTAFGSSHVILEKYMSSPRHIEVQVLSDQHGQHFHLGERECSLQRRYQKIVEEAPSVALDNQLRNEMTQMAVRVSESIQYRGVGTVEFLLDDQGNYYFLEMNTRLQVEHAVTEMIYGLDLVYWQIKVAQGEKLPFKQSDLMMRGHSFEVRLYAEDPSVGHLPTTGMIQKLLFPTTPGTRWDFGYAEGNEVGLDYDPMIGKIVVWGETRDMARKKMIQVLKDFVILGFPTNRDYLIQIFKNEIFIKGDLSTAFCEVNHDVLLQEDISDEDLAKCVAVTLLNKTQTGHETQDSFIDELLNFRNV